MVHSHTQYILLYCQPRQKKKNQNKNTEKEREKNLSSALGEKKSQYKCYKKVNNAMEVSRIKGNISFLRFGMGNNEVCRGKYTLDKDSAPNLVLNLSRIYDIVSDGTES